MKTKLTHVRANVRDLEKAVEWYETVLGFECSGRDVGERWAYADFSNDGGAVFALAVDENVPSHGRFNFDVDDVNALWERLKHKVDVVQPIETMPYGTRKFTIRDLDGNELGFVQQNYAAGAEKSTKSPKKAGRKKSAALPLFNEDDLFDAQELAFDAWEEPNPKKRIALAKKAMQVSPYCVDAYNILAQSSQTPAEGIELYRQGLEIGKKALGEDFFEENKGYFWGLIETRPYMRAMEGLADCLWATGERDRAIEIYQEMLRLNPNDNQGVRYSLLHWLIAQGMFEAAERLLSDYAEPSAFILYGAALLYFRQARKVKAKNALTKAIGANPHVPEFLLKPKKKYVPQSEAEILFGGYQPGHASEADEYRILAGEVWRETPGALDWLKTSLS